MIHIVPTRSPTLTVRMLDLVRAVDHGNLIGALQLGDGALRDQQGALAGFWSPRELWPYCPGTQNVSGIGKQSGQPDRAGALIHLAVGEEELAGLRIDRAVGQDQLELQSSGLRVPAGLRRKSPVEVEILLLADGEVDFDRDQPSRPW